MNIEIHELDKHKEDDFELLDELVEIESQCFDVPWTRDDFSGFLDDTEEETHIAVATHEGKIVGYVAYTFTSPASLSALTLEPICEINSIAVLPEFRRKGVGTQLMDYVRSQTNEMDIALAVRTTNFDALSFFKQVGIGNIIEKEDFFETHEPAYVLRIKTGKAPVGNQR